jgi:hypothetical protein
MLLAIAVQRIVPAQRLLRCSFMLGRRGAALWTHGFPL